MSFLGAVADDYAGHLIHGALGCQGLAALEAAAPSLRDAVLAGSGWVICVADLLPGFVLLGELRAIASGGGCRQKRAELKELCFKLSHATTVPGTAERLHALEGLRRLATLVSRASAVEAETCSGGGTAQVLAARLTFQNAVDAPWRQSMPISFSLPRPASKRSSRSSAGSIRPQPRWACVERAAVAATDSEELQFHLMWGDNSAYLCITEKCGPGPSSTVPGTGRRVFREAAPDSDQEMEEFDEELRMALASRNGDQCRQLSVDIASVSQAPLLLGRDTRVNVGGPWTKVNGICADMLGKALATGLVCVLCIRDSVVPHQVPVASHAMNLEAMRRRR